ncbi:MAG: hypothetical protein HRF43_14250 [Phycisphaerae bacterium]
MQVINAIGWAHYQLRGGWKNILATTVGYAVLIGLLIFGSVYLDPSSAPSIYAGWTMALLALQVGALVLYGCWSVSSAVKKDISTKMIESHRLMPVSGTDAIAGYLFGPTSQVLTIALANFLIGCATLQGATPLGSGLVNWFKVNAILGIFAVSAWTVMVFLPLVFPMATSLLAGAVFILIMGYQMVPALLPGASLLVGPALQESIFGMLALGRPISPELMVSIVAQLVVAALCYIGAQRKYRRDDVPAWGPLLGLAVVGTYVLISMRGLSTWEVFRPRGWWWETPPFAVQLTLAAMGGLIVAIIPVSVAARQEVTWRRRRALHDPAPNPRPLPGMLIVALAAAIAASLLPLAVGERWSLRTWHPQVFASLRRDQLPSIAAPPFPPGLVARTFLVYFAFLTVMSFFLRLLFARGIRSRWLPVMFVALLGLAPLLVDVTVNGAMKRFETDDVFSAISGASPIVALVYLWSPVKGADGALISTMPGIAAQLVLGAVLGLIYYASLRRGAGTGMAAGGRTMEAQRNRDGE